MIDDKIIIDFEIPKTLQYAIEDAEKAYAEEGELGSYMNWAKTIDNLCKLYYTEGVFTKKQWDTIVSKYPE